MRPYASPRPLAWLSAAVLLSAALLPPVIRDAPGADPTSPEGGSNSVTEKPAAKKLLPENRKLVAREPPAEIALSKKPLVRLPPAKKKSAAERTVAKTEDGGGRTQHKTASILGKPVTPPIRDFHSQFSSVKQRLR